MLRIIGWFLTLLGLLGAGGELLNLALPTVRWPFEVSRDFDFLAWGEFYWFGWLVVGLALASGLFILIALARGFAFSPITERRFGRFKSIRRGWVSFVILLLLAGFAMLDQAVVGGRALVVKYEGGLTFPAFQRDLYQGKQFGLTGGEAEPEPDYLALKKQFREKGEGNWVLMPLIPYAQTGTSLPPIAKELDQGANGLIVNGNKPFSGLAAKLYDVDDPDRIHLRYRYRKGKPDGDAIGRSDSGEQIWSATFRSGELVKSSYSGTGTEADFLALESSALHEVYYHAAPPLPQRGHLLGTTSQGYDVVAYLFGGLQVNFKAALFYIPCIYVIGVSMGLLMGFWGGWFDLAVQRLIEILSSIPFLYVVIILSASVPENYRGLGVILFILVAFGWMGMTYLMRGSALRERSRDYVAASRVLGASTSRLVFRHILPNSVAIIVTLIPFSVSGVVLALTSLDYLGFGLPPSYATWGSLLKDGLQNLSKPWLVSSAFVSLVSLLILVTFVGEAVREAFDPKKFTYYK